jgi:TRAP-type C4-dicarboxylate transport system permease small subunit
MSTERRQCDPISQPLSGPVPTRRRPDGAARVLSAASFVLGSAGLLVAMAADAAAVAGRHIGLPFLGSIEMVQAAMIVAASAAIAGSTMRHGHAAVHVVIERLSPVLRRRCQTLADTLSALFFLVLAAGSIWLVVDLWRGAERSELLGLPLKPLRLVWCASALLVASVFAARAIRPGERER